MRDYTYHSRIVRELYRDGALSRCEIITLHDDGSMTNHQMWMTTKMFEEALDGCQETKACIDRVYADLVKYRRI